MTVVIPEGSSTYDVAKILKSKGLIDDSLVFFAQEKLSTYKGQMQAGTYLIKYSLHSYTYYGYSCW